ncbi:MAG: iron-sulfur cluster repair di-iron protein [Myxococcota bacterium]|nr:iron-sulfur cluster repair di-iron protein [Myxococcota bacterium]
MLDPTQTVARLVLDHSECATVLKRHRIDFCCRGDVSIEAVCAEKGIDPQVLLTELSAAIAERRGEAGADPRAMSTPALIGHIVAKHHEYLRKALPFVRALSAKVSHVHGAHDPRLTQLDATVQALVDALLPHLDEEEQVLFPAMMGKSPDAALIARELGSMQEDHLAVGALLEQMRDATEDYRLPEWACNSYRTLFSELAQLEGDVLTHVHLENHVLQPRFAAIAPSPAEGVSSTA